VETAHRYECNGREESGGGGLIDRVDKRTCHWPETSKPRAFMSMCSVCADMCNAAELSLGIIDVMIL